MKIIIYVAEGADVPPALKYSAAMVLDDEPHANWWCTGPTPEGAAKRLSDLYQKELAHYAGREGKKKPARKKMEEPLRPSDPGDVI